MKYASDDLVIVKTKIEGIKWHHVITDNTFDKNESEIISSYFKEYDELHSEENYIRYVTGKEYKLAGFSGIAFFPNTLRWTNIIQDILDNTHGAKKFYGNANDHIVVLELVITAPNFNYKWHTDVERKAFTGVCYWGDKGEGTILRSKDTNKIVNWKHNRALWFSNYDRNSNIDKELQPWHKYENNSDNARTTVNINFTPQNHIHEFLNQKKDQLQYWLINKSPLWLPMFSGDTVNEMKKNERILNRK